MRVPGFRLALPVWLRPKMSRKWARAGAFFADSYSFYGDGNETLSGKYNTSIKSVGKVLYVNDYE